jgi:hypothetical protein
MEMTELEDIRRKFESGQLDSIKTDLERFLVQNRAEIARYQEEQGQKGLSLTDETAVKFYILRYGSINARREITEQLEEIQREKWIRGERLGRPPDAQEVARDWAKKHSAGWRSHRLTTIIYCFDREKDRYLKLLG